MNLPKPTGYRLLIEPVQVKQQSAGGIALPEQAVKAQEYLRYIGKVVAMGPEAYQHEKFQGAWCEVGDWIAYGQYAGQELVVRTEEGPRKLRLINDDEVLARVDPQQMMIYDV